MEALIELVQSILEFLVEATIHAVAFIFLLLMASFSPRYRQKLKAQWNTSNWQRFAISLGVVSYSTALIIALVVWIPILTRSSAPKPAVDPKNSITIKFSDDEVHKMKKTKRLDELVDAAGNIIKRKLIERKKQSVESDAAGQTP